MDITEHQKAIYELHVENEKIALLYEPIAEEMFWCSYRIEATSASADKLLRNKNLWQCVGFTIKDESGNMPNPETFSAGDYKSFCNGETERISFRSLWPPEARSVTPKSQSIWERIKAWFI
ncbi:MAG: hypothetical protein JXR97_07565 [Planctomycetes bacterium]|nr:hypothetical protein [Planctomycetota bacterium]